jgi:hypothetical protein
VAISLEQIVALFTERRKVLQPVHAKMRELQAAVNGDIDLPMPELDRSDRPLVANLIEQGLTQHAMRVASTMPDVQFPAMRPGIQASEEKARNRRLAVLSWWEMNRINLLQRERARNLLGYGCAPVVIRPDNKRQIPKWEKLDPLSTFWSPRGGVTPDDIIFTFTKPLRWLKSRYPEQAARLSQGERPSPDDMHTVLAYMDGDETVMMAFGRADSGPAEYWGAATPWPAQKGAPYTLLDRGPAKIGMCPAVNPCRITLDRLTGQFDSSVALFWNQAMLMALEVIMVKRGIFPDEWVIARPNETPQIIAEADGVRGERGILAGGDIKPMNLQPGVQTYPTIDRIERALRVAGGIPAELTGESPSNIRTGRRGSQVLSSTIDYAIQESQEVLATALEEENVRAIAVAKAFFPGKRSFFVSWNGRSEWTEYDPMETFETDRHKVRYSMPGANVNEMLVGGGQRVGMGTLSKESWMRMDPMVDDPEFELRRVEIEGLRAAAMQSIQSQAAAGQIPPADLARIIELRVKGIPIEKAVIKVQEEAQLRQSQTVDPVEPGAPEAQPGLAMPGMGAEAGTPPPAIGEGPASIANLVQSIRQGRSLRQEAEMSA